MAVTWRNRHCFPKADSPNTIGIYLCVKICLFSRDKTTNYERRLRWFSITHSGFRDISTQRKVFKVKQISDVCVARKWQLNTFCSECRAAADSVCKDLWRQKWCEPGKHPNWWVLSNGFIKKSVWKMRKKLCLVSWILQKIKNQESYRKFHEKCHSQKSSQKSLPGPSSGQWWPSATRSSTSPCCPSSIWQSFWRSPLSSRRSRWGMQIEKAHEIIYDSRLFPLVLVRQISGSKCQRILSVWLHGTKFGGQRLRATHLGTRRLQKNVYIHWDLSKGCEVELRKNDKRLLYAIKLIVLRHWLFGAVLCKLYWVLEIASKMCSTFILCALSFDRYMAICHPTKRVSFWKIL